MASGLMGVPHNIVLETFLTQARTPFEKFTRKAARNPGRRGMVMPRIVLGFAAKMFSLQSNAAAANVQESKSGTELAWDSLYRRHQASLVSFACRRGCDEHEAWDVVQELFLRMFRRGDIARISMLAEDIQRGWLIRSLRWVIFNHYRDRTTMKRGSTQKQESLDDLLDQGLEIASGGTPATEHDRRWAMAVLERGLERLRADMKPGAWAGFESSLSGRSTHHTPAMRVASHRARLRLREVILRESSQNSLYQAMSGDN